MLFKLTVQPITDTGTCFKDKGRPLSMFAVGDTHRGWLSDRRAWNTRRKAEQALGHAGMSSMRTDVWQHGQWEIVSVGMD